MAKKIRFALSLSDGTQARSLDELKEHFDLESVVGHYKSGKLLTWLRDRYFETEADAVEALDENAPDFQQKLCEVFGAQFDGNGANMEAIARRQERLGKLRQFTDEDEFIQNIDAVAFDQEELADLLDEGCEKIYLCGDKFSVPASVQNKTYIGVNSPAVHISGNVGDDWVEREITFTGCEVDNLPALAFSAAPADDEGPIVITDEMAGNIFDAIFEAASDEICGREIIAETDRYFVIEEKLRHSEGTESAKCTHIIRYLRFEKTICSFEELPDLSTFSVASKYHRGFHYKMEVSRPKIQMLRAPTYQYKDLLYMQEISDSRTPSIWCLNLHSKVLTKLIDGVRFFCPNLPAVTFPCEGRYIPVIKDGKFCVLDIRSSNLIKVRNKGQWIDAPYGAAVAGNRVYFVISEIHVGRADSDKKAFCSFDLEQSEFSEVQVVVQKDGDSTQLLCSHAYWHNNGCRTNVDGLYVQGNKIMVFLSSYYDKGFLIDISTQPICATVLENKYRSIIWGDKLMYLESSYLTITDIAACKKIEKIKLGPSDITYDRVFARIGNYVYINGDWCANDGFSMLYILTGSWRKGYRISLSDSHEQVPISYKIHTANNDSAFEWKAVPELS